VPVNPTHILSGDALGSVHLIPYSGEIVSVYNIHTHPIISITSDHTEHQYLIGSSDGLISLISTRHNQITILQNIKLKSSIK
jgi:WD40 repeat protein